jgi:molecular chaperone DnaK
MADDGEGYRNARICIDFGTALSKASVCLDPTMPLDLGVRPLPIGAVSGAEHPLLTPSVLFVANGRLHFGPTAFQHARQGIEAGRDPLLSFKTVLGARQVDAALASRIPLSVDPTGTLRQRDALVLYLAYLDQLIREALSRALNMPPGIAGARRRYTSPVWRANDGQDVVFEGIFNEAAAVSQKLGRLFLSPEGISIAQCKDALDKAAAAPGNGRLETGVFEPHAAAAASLAFTNAPTRFVLVFDMGAGTTDIAAFDFDESTDPPSLTELKEARQCSALAGDEIDRILLDLHLRKRGRGKSREEDASFMRTARLNARELKKDLFLEGKCTFKDGWKSTTIKAIELAEDQNFRNFLTALGRTIAVSLSETRKRAEAARVGVVDVVLAGGGSHLPFLPDLVRAAAEAAPSGVGLRVGPLSPASGLYDDVDPYFAEVFPQIAMSIGGAIVEMLPSDVS